MRRKAAAARVILAIAGILLGVRVVRGDEPNAEQAVRAPGPAASPTAGICGGDASKDATAPSVENNPATVEGIEAAKTAIKTRLGQLSAAGEKDKASDPARDPQVKDLRAALQTRLTDLDLWRTAVSSRVNAKREAAAPEHEVADLDAKLKRALAQLDLSRKSPEAILPDLFRVTGKRATETSLTEMKDAITIVLEQSNDIKAQLDAMAKAQAIDKTTATFVGLRTDREKCRAAIAGLATRDVELDAALVAATTPAARELARQRRLSVELETRIEIERLQEIEAKIALERQKSSHQDLQSKSLLAQSELAKRTLVLMQARYRNLADEQQHDLEKAAAREQDRAAKTYDPVERYRAKKAAFFLDLQALILHDEQELTSSPRPTLQEQTDLLGRAKQEFEETKTLVAGDRSTALVATRLTNSFRRLAVERELVTNRELAQATLRLTRYENALTEVELDLVNDTREDQLEVEGILAELPRRRQAHLTALAEAMELKHRSLLESRRRVLKKLVWRAEQTRLQIVERIHVLDEQHAFIRTHIFWVRDAAPLSAATFMQLPRESFSLARAGLAIAGELRTASPRDGVTPSYLLAMIGVVSLPLGLYRARRSLRALGDSAPRVPSDL